MGRRAFVAEQMMARLTAGTTARMDAVLGPGEKRPDFVRAAIERELSRREAALQRKSSEKP